MRFRQEVHCFMFCSRLALISAVSASLLFASCTDSALRKAADPPATPLLSRPLGWAVIDSAYVQVFDIPSSKGVVLGYYRKGTAVPVTERRFEQDAANAPAWLKNEGEEPGWIKASDALLFDSPEKAATASRSLNAK